MQGNHCLSGFLGAQACGSNWPIAEDSPNRVAIKPSQQASLQVCPDVWPQNRQAIWRSSPAWLEGPVSRAPNARCNQQPSAPKQLRPRLIPGGPSESGSRCSGVLSPCQNSTRILAAPSAPRPPQGRRQWHLTTGKAGVFIGFPIGFPRIEREADHVLCATTPSPPSRLPNRTREGNIAE